MAGSRAETKTLDKIVSITNDQAGFATRVYQGYRRFTGAEDFVSLVEGLTAKTQGYACYWINGFDRRPPDPQALEIAGEVVIYIPKDTSDDLNSVWELVMGLVDELMDPTNYSSGEMVPTRVPCELREIKTVRNGGIAYFDLGSGGAPIEVSIPGNC